MQLPVYQAIDVNKEFIPKIDVKKIKLFRSGCLGIPILYLVLHPVNASLAQLVEQLTCNQ